MNNKNKQEKSKSTLFDTFAVGVFLALGLIGLGYGAVSAINKAVHKTISKKTAQKSISCDTINYNSVKKWIDAENQR